MVCSFPAVKVLARIALALFLLLVVAGAGLRVWVGRQLTGESLVRLVEKEIAAEVELGEVGFSLWSFPARVTVKDAVFRLSGEPSGKGVPEGFPPPVRAKRLDLKLNVWALLRKELDVRELSLHEPEIHVALYEEGGNTLEDLFSRPDAIGRKEEKPAAGQGSEQEKPPGELDHWGGYLARLKGVRIVNGSAELLIAKSGSKVRVRGLNLDLHDIALDLADLGQANRARSTFPGRSRWKAPSRPCRPTLA